MNTNNKYPYFLFIGAGKTGSRWLTKVLKNHPQVFVASIDMYFFDRDENYNKGLNWYKSFFQNANNSHIAVGELSHDYLYSKTAAKRIYKFNKDMKLIINLRNPVDLCFSTHNAEYNGGLTDLTFNDAMISNDDLIFQAKYYEHIKFYFQYFDKKNILILKYDELVNNKYEFLRQIFEFLNVKNIKELGDIPAYNTAKKPRIKIFGIIAKKSANLLRKFNLLTALSFFKNNSLIKKLLFKKKKGNTLSSVDKKMLIKYFIDDIKKTEKLTGMNLKNWYL